MYSSFTQKPVEVPTSSKNSNGNSIRDLENNVEFPNTNPAESEAFENQIASSMDALDNIGPDSLSAEINLELNSKPGKKNI